MYFVSTRDENGKRFTATEAIMKGLAPDGGLFIPERIPSLPPTFTMENGYAYAAYEILKPYFEGDESYDDLYDICLKAFSFPVSIHQGGDGNDTLELYYGPTSAFKDFGARFLAFFMENRLRKTGEGLTVLVATSGDTGGAVASAFHEREHLCVKVLFPKGGVSERQMRQLTCFDGNVESFEVDGTFDDCQKMVKDAFMDPELKGLTSANSINLGRLLPQVVYYVWASFIYEARYHKKAVFIVPSGNVGNSTGAFWAKAMGAPIEHIELAVNANRTIPDYLESGEYKPRKSCHTLANAMDVGAPSNMERLFSLFKTYEEFKENVTSHSVDDLKIRLTIKDVYDESGYVICPHTACAEYVRRKYYEGVPTIVVATAHPAKFESIVEPVIGKTVPIPETLYDMITRDCSYTEIGTDYKDLF